jgi:hypothetical protein
MARSCKNSVFVFFTMPRHVMPLPSPYWMRMGQDVLDSPLICFSSLPSKIICFLITAPLRITVWFGLASFLSLVAHLSSSCYPLRHFERVSSLALYFSRVGFWTLFCFALWFSLEYPSPFLCSGHVAFWVTTSCIWDSDSIFPSDLKESKIDLL